MSGEQKVAAVSAATSEYRIAAGNGRPGAGETSARGIFRQFTAQELAQVFAFNLQDAGSLSQLIEQAYTRINLWGFKPILAADLDRVGREFPDVGALCVMLQLFNGEAVVNQFPDRFRQLANQPEATVEQLLSMELDRVVDLGTINFLSLAVLAAFTKPEQRGSLHRDSWPEMSEREFNWVVAGVADFSQLETVEERFEAIVSLLTPTFKSALAQAWGQEGWEVEQLKVVGRANPELAKRIEAQARTKTQNNFYNLLVDAEGNGKNNLFRVGPEVSQDDILTDRHECPAAPLTAAWLEGVGLALAQKREVVLTAITQVDLNKVKAELKGGGR